MLLSVCITLNTTILDFRHRFDALKNDALGTGWWILVGRDFNAKALKWGTPLNQTPEENGFSK